MSIAVPTARGLVSALSRTLRLVEMAPLGPGAELSPLGDVFDPGGASLCRLLLGSGAAGRRLAIRAGVVVLVRVLRSRHSRLLVDDEVADVGRRADGLVQVDRERAGGRDDGVDVDAGPAGLERRDDVARGRDAGHRDLPRRG